MVSNITVVHLNQRIKRINYQANGGVPPQWMHGIGSGAETIITLRIIEGENDADEVK